MAFNVDLSLPHEFKNKVRLFPLPNVVLFPGVMQGLHIFEPRYRQLMEDALATDQLITMAVLKTNSPPLPAQAMVDCDPEIHSTVCIGKIVTHSRTEDGRFNLLLVGSKRARVICELMTDKAYRSAEVEVIEDTIESPQEQIAQLREQLIASFLSFATETQGVGHESIKNMLVDSMPFGLLVDLISYAVGLNPQNQIKILETTRADLRCQYVLEMIQQKKIATTQSPGDNNQDGFPPGFSLN